ncbi:MAG: YdcF family protein [Mycobacteriales bacterium]
MLGVTALRVWQVARTDNRRPADVIIVLGASQFDGRPSAVFQARLDHALSLYKDKVAPRIVTVGGGQPGDRFTEGEAGALYLGENRLPASALVPVGEGRDTLASLQAAAPVLAQSSWRSAVLVTDPWHCLRSRQMAHDLGIKAETSPARTGPAVHDRGTEIRYVARETAAYLYYRVFHRGFDAGPSAV